MLLNSCDFHVSLAFPFVTVRFKPFILGTPVLLGLGCVILYLPSLLCRKLGMCEHHDKGGPMFAKQLVGLADHGQRRAACM